MAAFARAAAIPEFHRDVAPILYRHCASCHHTGDIAPFPLLTYSDAVSRAKEIAKAVRKREMPPWLPEAGYGRFAGERRLTSVEIATLERWVSTGAVEGNPDNGPKPPVFTPGAWKLGPPDLVLSMPEPFSISAQGDDQYQCFGIPAELMKDRYVRAVQFRPSNRRVVHHALLFTGHAPGKSYSCFGTPGMLPTSSLGGWSPGSGPVQMPPGTAQIMKAGADLVLQVHFHATGKPESEQSQVGIYFTDTPPVRKIMDAALWSRAIDIPAGDAHYPVTDHFTLPIAVEVTGIIPHAHYLCREMRGWAVLPDGRKRWLLLIRDWDFDWQDQYRYATPMHLPADTRLEMEFIYDNSSANPRNPNSPPKRVRWGGGSTDEMAGLHVQVIPEHAEDLPELGKALWGKVMRSVGGEFYRPVRP